MNLKNYMVSEKMPDKITYHMLPFIQNSRNPDEKESTFTGC